MSSKERFILPPQEREHEKSPTEKQERMLQTEYGLALMQAADPEKLYCEDAAYADQTMRIACVCDGVGAGVAGDIAAQTVINLLKTPNLGEDHPSFQPLFADFHLPQTQMDIEQAIEDFFVFADERVRQTFDQFPVQKRLQEKFEALHLQGGTKEAQEQYQEFQRNHLTTCVLFKGWKNTDGKEYISFGSIGDSRLYRRRQGVLERLTSDDTMVEPFRKYGYTKDNGDLTQTINLKQINHLLDRVDVDFQDIVRARSLKEILEKKKLNELPLSEISHYILNSLGLQRAPEDPLMCEIHTLAVEEGDEYYLMTDGVENYTDQELQEFLEEKNADEANVQKLSEEIILHGNALDRKDDDFAVVVVRYTNGMYEGMKSPATDADSTSGS